jgi:hypothetical protein
LAGYNSWPRALPMALDRLPVPIVSVYPYINAVVAMGVGVVRWQTG